MNPTLIAKDILDEVTLLANRLLNTEWKVDNVIYNLKERGWTFKLNSKKRVLGSCSFSNKTISLSKSLIEANPDLSIWDDTIKHEIAHAIDCHIRGKSDHSKLWKNVGIQVGCSTEILKAQVKVNSAIGKYTLVCPTCDLKIQRHRTKKRDVACAPCCNKHNQGMFTDKYKLQIIKNY